MRGAGRNKLYVIITVIILLSKGHRALHQDFYMHVYNMLVIKSLIFFLSCT